MRVAGNDECLHLGKFEEVVLWWIQGADKVIEFLNELNGIGAVEFLAVQRKVIHMSEATKQIVTVFRNRLAHGHEDAYGDIAPTIYRLAVGMPGFVDAKTFTSEDGERVTVVTFADRESHNAWRDHPDHLVAQSRGIAEFYSSYSIQVAEVTYSHNFTRAD